MTTSQTRPGIPVFTVGCFPPTLRAKQILCVHRLLTQLTTQHSESIEPVYLFQAALCADSLESLKSHFCLYQSTALPQPTLNDTGSTKAATTIMYAN